MVDWNVTVDFGDGTNESVVLSPNYKNAFILNKTNFLSGGLFDARVYQTGSIQNVYWAYSKLFAITPSLHLVILKILKYINF